MPDLIEPKTITIKTQKGEDREYTISKIPAIPAREIVTQYPISSLPKLGDYKVNEEIMLKMMSYVQVKTGPTDIRLTTRALIDNHVPDWEVLAKLEIAMLEYNCSFFRNGVASTFFEAIAQKVPAAISKILTGLQAQSSQKGAPVSTN